MRSNKQLFLRHLAQTSETPLMLEMDSAEGVYMYGADGKEYIDLISGIGVSNIGHRHPRVVNAIKKQVDQHLHVMVYGEFVQNPQVKLAEAITQTLPKALNSIYLVNSGSEAIEGAMKLAKRYTGRTQLIACKNAYHGSSHGALSLTGREDFKQNYRPLLPGVSHVAFGETEELNLINEETAAFVVETIQGEAGVMKANKAYWKAVKSKCVETGALLILDEIQCGFGRTGKFWAFDHYDITPDILVSAKGMGGGMPIGCFIANREVMHVFTNNPVLGHISTFGGHPVAAAASLATLQVILGDNLLDEVEEKSRLFNTSLTHPKVKVIRHKGLMMALEFESYDVLKPIIDKAIALGVITDWFLFNDRSMRIAPPLTIAKEEIKKACKLIIQAIESV